MGLLKSRISTAFIEWTVGTLALFPFGSAMTLFSYSLSERAKATWQLIL